MDKSIGEYPSDWPEIAEQLKVEHHYLCERCGHVHDVESGHVLTVHHILPDKALCEKWNLAVLCQRCHLSVQARFNLCLEVNQLSLFPVHGWWTPHLDGFREWLKSA